MRFRGTPPGTPVRGGPPPLNSPRAAQGYSVDGHESAAPCPKSRSCACLPADRGFNPQGRINNLCPPTVNQTPLVPPPFVASPDYDILLGNASEHPPARS